MKEITLQTQITACTVDELDAELRHYIRFGTYNVKQFGFATNNT